MGWAWEWARASVRSRVTAVDANAQAEGQESLILGTRLGLKDGTSTTYYKIAAEANASIGAWSTNPGTQDKTYLKAGLEGKVEDVVEVERDNKGNITAVRVKTTLAGKAEATEKGGTVDRGADLAHYEETVVELPTLTARDQGIAKRFLGAMGMAPLAGFNKGGVVGAVVDAVNATREFTQAAGDRGFITKQKFVDNGSTKAGAKFDAKLIAEIGLDAKFDVVDRKSTGQEYWNGSRFVPREGCTAKAA